MFIRRELPADVGPIDGVLTRAFRTDPLPGASASLEPPEVALVRELRAGPAWIPELSMVAIRDGNVVGHVSCVRCTLGDGGYRVLGLIPLSVDPRYQRQGVGAALVHSVLGAADALGEPLICLLGSPAYYGRFDFRPAIERSIEAPVSDWTPNFLVRTLTAFQPRPPGVFHYPDAVSLL